MENQKQIEELVLDFEKKKISLKNQINKINILEEALLRSYKINKAKIISQIEKKA